MAWVDLDVGVAGTSEHRVAPLKAIRAHAIVRGGPEVCVLDAILRAGDARTAAPALIPGEVLESTGRALAARGQAAIVNEGDGAEEGVAVDLHELLVRPTRHAYPYTAMDRTTTGQRAIGRAAQRRSHRAAIDRTARRGEGEHESEACTKQQWRRGKG